MTRGVPPAEQARQAALRAYFAGGDPAAAREIWRQQTDPPRDPSELAMAADLEAEAGSDTALPLIDKLRAYQPAEADTMLSTLRHRQLRHDEAATALVAALVRYRVDPWPLVRYKQTALTLATTLASTDPAAAPRIYDALKEPFAAHAVDNARRIAQFEVAATFDFKGRCRAAIDGLEPDVPWTGRFLTMRRDCYQLNHDPRVDAANRDLADFVAGEPLPLVRN